MRINDSKAKQFYQPVSNRILSLIGIMLLCAFCLAAEVNAQQTFKLSVTDEIATSFEGFDFRHVEVETANGTAASKDVTIWCHVEANNGRGMGTVSLVRPIPITLKAGQVSMERDLYLPQKQFGGQTFLSLDPNPRNYNKRLEVLHYGNDPAGDDSLVIQGPQSSSQAVAVFEAVFDDKFLKPEAWQTGTVPKDPNIYNYPLPSAGSFKASRKYWSIDLLPKRWIGYTCIEQIVIDNKRLLELSKDTERFEALMHWVAMGGTLFVWDCKDDFHSVPKLIRAVNSEQSASFVDLQFFQPTDRLEKKRARFINMFAGSNQRKLFANEFSQSGNETWGVNFSEYWEEIAHKKAEGGGYKFDTSSGLLLHRFAKGKIFFNSAAFGKASATQRVGMRFFSCGSSASRMLNFPGYQSSTGIPYEKWQLIDVGVAPKGLFVFVVMAFMLLIGPVGFSYLKVKQKLHYQIWLVPLISAAACLTLLGYAFLSEGVGTKLRPTVFVELDQNRHTAAIYGWYSIYSALQPRPYQFRDDQFATMEHDVFEAPATYLWSNEDYQLSGGYASARNVHQVFVATPVKTDSRIDVSQSNNKDSIKLTNRLKSEVKLLIVKANEKLYFAQNLAPTDSRVVASTNESDFLKTPELTKLFSQLLPANSQDYRSSGRDRYYRSSGRNARANTLLPRNDSIIEEVIAFSSIGGVKQKLQDGHFIAILDSMSEVPYVVPNAREINGRVFVHGKW